MYKVLVFTHLELPVEVSKNSQISRNTLTIKFSENQQNHGGLLKRARNIVAPYYVGLVKHVRKHCSSILNCSLPFCTPTIYEKQDLPLLVIISRIHSKEPKWNIYTTILITYLKLLAHIIYPTWSNRSSNLD